MPLQATIMAAPGGEIVQPLLHISHCSLVYEVVHDVANESTDGGEIV